jgi:hypothetical protein
MIKRPDTTVETQLIDPNTHEDKQIF